VTDNVTWPPKVLWGSTVGYPSDSLASCYLPHPLRPEIWQNYPTNFQTMLGSPSWRIASLTTI